MSESNIGLNIQSHTTNNSGKNDTPNSTLGVNYNKIYQTKKYHNNNLKLYNNEQKNLNIQINQSRKKKANLLSSISKAFLLVTKKFSQAIRRQKNNKLCEMENKIKLSFLKVKAELEDHLYAINQNTNEIQYNYQRILDIEEKVEKISQHVEFTINQMFELQNQINILPLIQKMIISEEINKTLPLTTFKPIQLSHEEQKIFSYLYIKDNFTNIKELSLRTGIKEENIKELINNMEKKGIVFNYKLFEVKLNDKFKKLQMKKNIVKIDPKIMKKLA